MNKESVIGYSMIALTKLNYSTDKEREIEEELYSLIRYFIEDLGCQDMTNAAAIGYAMIALANLGYNEEDAKKVEKEMYYLMDVKTEEEAEEYYQNH